MKQEVEEVLKAADKLHDYLCGEQHTHVYMCKDDYVKAKRRLLAKLNREEFGFDANGSPVYNDYPQTEKL